MNKLQRNAIGVMRLALCYIFIAHIINTSPWKHGYVIIALGVSTLDTWPSAVGRISTSNLDLFCSMCMVDVIDSLSLCVCRFVLRFRRESKLKSEATYYFTQIVRPVGGAGGVGFGVQWGKLDGYMSYVPL